MSWMSLSRILAHTRAPAVARSVAISVERDGRLARLRGGFHRHRAAVAIGALILLCGAAGVARVSLAALAEHPGHADEAFYHVVARNLVAGRGLQIDYVWHYLSPPPAVTHPAHDYWLPLTSLVIGGAFWLVGVSVFAALLPAIAAALALGIVAYLWSLRYAPCRVAAVGAASMVLLEPTLFAFSLTTATAMYYALLVSLGLLFMVVGLSSPRAYLAAAGCAGLAAVTRHDGPLLLATLVVAIATSGHPRATRGRLVGGCLGVYVLVLAPWLLYNIATFGRPYPPGSLKLLFLTQYEDLYAYAKDISPGAYLRSGLASIAAWKIDAGLAHLHTLSQISTGVVWLLAAVGLVGLWRAADRRAAILPYLPPLCFLGGLWAFHTFVATFSGGAFMTSSVSTIPFLIIAMVHAVRRYVRSTPIVACLMALGVGYLYVHCFDLAGATIAANNKMGRQLEGLRRAIETAGGGRASEGAVIMTRIPWEVHYSTGYRAIQIPNDDLPTILAVARRYGADFLLLPAPRAALASLYHGTLTDPRFEPVATIPYSDPYLAPDAPLKLFRLRLATDSRSLDGDTLRAPGTVTTARR